MINPYLHIIILNDRETYDIAFHFSPLDSLVGRFRFSFIGNSVDL